MPASTLVGAGAAAPGTVRRTHAPAPSSAVEGIEQPSRHGQRIDYAWMFPNILERCCGGAIMERSEFVVCAFLADWRKLTSAYWRGPTGLGWRFG